MHRLFAKQLAKATGPDGIVDVELLGRFVATAYEESDRDRRRTERSITLMIEELETLNAAKLRHMERHDALTDLPNRILFRERLTKALYQSGSGAVAVFSIDLDQFKTINETLGHPAGDQLLVAVADRLRATVGEHGVVARFGGDEFAILQAGSVQPFGSTALGHRLMDAFGKPFGIDGTDVLIGLAAGIAVSPGDGIEADQLVKNAGIAVCRLKEDRGSGFRYFEAGMDQRMRERRAVEQDLRNALATGEFELYYQPVISLRNDRVAGFEALLRWNHPTRGLVQPADFVPIAEEVGVILPLGEWALRQACRDAATWPADLWVAVNISPYQFVGRNNLFSDVMAAAEGAGISPARLMLEITETALLQDSDATLAMLHQFRAHGVRICMDDFGTGYSSLGYLRRFPFDKIKIDRSFIRDFPYRKDSLSIVRAAIGLGASLGMATTAEGVERPEQVESLRAYGCDEVQGFYFSKPRPAAEIPSMLAGIDHSPRAVA